MIRILALLFLSTIGYCATDAPYHLKKMDDVRDVGAVNENFRAQSSSLKKLSEELDALPTLSGNNSWTGNNTFSGKTTFTDASTFTGTGYFGSSITVAGALVHTDMTDFSLSSGAAGGSITGAPVTLEGSTITVRVNSTSSIVRLSFHSNIQQSSTGGCYIDAFEGNTARCGGTYGCFGKYAATYDGGGPQSVYISGLSAGNHSFWIGYTSVTTGYCSMPSDPPWTFVGEVVRN